MSAFSSEAAREFPRLAVLTPSYNRPNGLLRVHESLSRQKVDLEWLHIVVDDASSPLIDPAAIFPDRSRLEFHRNCGNFGPLVTRNIAIECGLRWGADLFAFVDDDDEVADGFFEYISDVWREQRHVGWYVSRCLFGDGQTSNGNPWPETDGIYDWFDDVQLSRRFCSDVMHVVSAERIRNVRFSKFGRYQREWTFLAGLARGGGFYASNRITKIVVYGDDGMTRNTRGPAPDLPTIWNYVAKPLMLVRNRPGSATAWLLLLRQSSLVLPRLILLSAKRMKAIFRGDVSATSAQ
jgi:glycosyltransferase involved in cell wall biosynthesis